MRKTLIVITLSLLVCAAAAAVIATEAAAQAPSQPPAPRLLEQPYRVMPPGARPGRGRGAPPDPARTAERRAQLCQDLYARAAGRFAELEVRLNLTGAQTAAFARWRDVRLAAAKARATECAARPAPQPGGRGGRGANATPLSPVERLSREETRLQHRLADIQAERPALDALYNSLSPEQRQTLARNDRLGGRGGMMRRGPMMGGPRGMTMRRGPGGPMGRGPMGRGGLPDSQNPPPPAQ